MYFFSLCWMVVSRKLSLKYVNSIKRRNVAIEVVHGWGGPQGGCMSIGYCRSVGGSNLEPCVQ